MHAGTWNTDDRLRLLSRKDALLHTGEYAL